MEPAQRMPTLFVGHGNPMNAILDNQWTRGWTEMARTIPEPKSILVLSAHWYLPGSYTTANHDPKTIHDFGGFSQDLFDVQYPAPGNPGLANRVSAMLSHCGSQPRSDWGLDHGTWSVLSKMYPEADVPVIQLSIDARATYEQHLEIGRTLAPLRDEGILIMGSGNLVHNLRSALQKMRANDQSVPSWARHFDGEASRALKQGDHDFLAEAPATEEGRMCHPSPDHYIPLLYAAGAADPSDAVSFPVEGFELGLSMRCVRFG